MTYVHQIYGNGPESSSFERDCLANIHLNSFKQKQISLNNFGKQMVKI
jgi:hypothetical protein